MGKKILIGVAFLTALGVAVYLGIDALTRSRVEKEIDRRVAETSAVESLDYKKLEVGFLGAWLRLEDVSLQVRGLDEKIVIDRVEIPEYRLVEDQLAGLRMEMEKLRLPPGFYTDTSTSLSANGKEGGNATANLTLEYDYNPGKRKLKIENFLFESRDLGDAEIQLELNNIDPSAISLENPMASMPMLIGVSIVQGNISYSEGAALKYILRDPDGNPSHVLRFLTSNINREIKRAKQKGSSRKVLDTMEKIRRFLQKPGKIRVSASPESPIPLGRFVLIRNPADVIGILNLEVEL